MSNILDRFHAKSHVPKAVNEVNKLDVAKLKEEKQETIFAKCKYMFLKNPENLTEKHIQCFLPQFFTLQSLAAEQLLQGETGATSDFVVASALAAFRYESLR